MQGNQPLSGVRVAEVGGASLEYAGKLLSNLGADVVKVERAAGDPSRRFSPRDLRRLPGLQGLTFNYHNAGKRSVIADLSSPDGLLVGLGSWADVILTDRHSSEWERAGVTWDGLLAWNPRLVLVAVTPFGLNGPRAGWNGSDLVALAAGGLLALTGEPDGAPHQLAGSQAFQTAGTYAALSALVGLAAVEKGGPGQIIDVSLQEAVATLTTLVGVPKMLADGVPSLRQPNGRASGGHPTGLYTASDGLISISLARAAMWPILANWIHEVTGIDEVLDPMFEGSGLNRQQHADLIDMFIEEMTHRFTARELLREGQRRGLAFALVSTPDDLLRDPHFEERSFWVSVPGEPGKSAGAPFRFQTSTWGVQGPVPRPGEHQVAVSQEIEVQEQRGPAMTAGSPPRGALSGVRVVEFTVAGAGPWVGRHLSYHGAEIIRVESHGHPDFVRSFVPPWDPGRGVDPQASPWLAEWNAGKLNAGLNLAAPGGRELARMLCLTADVIIENHKPGFLDKNGLGFDALSDANPALVMMSMQGYGTSGPYKDFLSWGYNLEPMAGLSVFSGDSARPMSSSVAYPDWLAGLHGAIAILAALRDRSRTGEGQLIELAQVETAISTIGSLFRDFSVNGTTPERIGNRSLNWAPQGVYRGLDRPDHFGATDTWLALSVTSDSQWHALCALMARDDLASRFATTESRLAAQDELDALISAWMAGRDVASTAEQLQAAGVPAYLAQDADDLLHDEHLAARNFFQHIPHAAKGTEIVTGLAGKFSGTPTGVPYSGGPIGGDNRLVFTGLLGLSDEAYRAAAEAGAIEEPRVKR